MKKILAAITITALLGMAEVCAQEAHERRHEHPEGPGLFGQPPEYVHVLINPLPTYGLGLGLLVLGAALLTRSKPARAIGLAIVVVSSASVWPVINYGESAYKRIKAKADEPGQHWLDEHMERADKASYVFYGTALLGIAALLSQKKFPKTGLSLTILTLVTSGVSLGLGTWISKAGGQIRHPEFRMGATPSHEASPHEHGAPGQPHETMPHDKMQSTNAPDGHQHAAPSQTTEKTPLPNTVEEVWKAIHEHHQELESAVTAKRFSDVQSHAQSTTDLMRRLVEVSPPDQKVAIENGANKTTQALAALNQSAETGSELVMKNNFDEFAKALSELEQQRKKE